jgi:hypothetical protein
MTATFGSCSHISVPECSSAVPLPSSLPRLASGTICRKSHIPIVPGTRQIRAISREEYDILVAVEYEAEQKKCSRKKEGCFL